MTGNQGRPWRYSYIVVKSIKEFAFSYLPPRVAGPYAAFLVLVFQSAPRSINNGYELFMSWVTLD